MKITHKHMLLFIQIEAPENMEISMLTFESFRLFINISTSL